MLHEEHIDRALGAVLPVAKQHISAPSRVGLARAGSIASVDPVRGLIS